MKRNSLMTLMALAGLCLVLPTAAQTAPQIPPSPPDPRGGAFRALNRDRSHAGRLLDLKGCKLTFEDNFDTLSVMREGGKGPWLAPVHSDFGAAKFLPPESDGPFFVADGVLTIRAKKMNGEWLGFGPAGVVNVAAPATVTFQTDGTPGASLLSSTSRVILSGSSGTPVSALAPTGWRFVNWTSNGRIDLYKRGCFVLEAKQGIEQEQAPVQGRF